MNRTDLRSQSLDLLRFPLALVVLTIHVFTSEGLMMQGNRITFEDFPVLTAINHIIDAFLRGQSVPIYFFISGFVFFLGIEWDKPTYLRKLRNRIHTLLIPYIIWNLVALGWRMWRLLPAFSSLFPNAYRGHLDFSLSHILMTFWNVKEGIIVIPPLSDEVVNNYIYPIDVPLWFLRDLMIVVLLTPILYRLLKQSGHCVVLLLGILWFVTGYGNSGYLHQLLTAFFFFSWGACQSIHRLDMMKEFRRFWKPSLFLYLSLGLLHLASSYYFPEWMVTIKQLNVIVGLLFAYNLSAWLLKRGICRVSPFLAPSSFFIYITHTLFCSDILKSLYYVFRPASDGGLLLIYVATVLLTAGGLLFAFWCLRRYAPRFLRITTGRK